MSTHCPRVSLKMSTQRALAARVAALICGLCVFPSCSKTNAPTDLVDSYTPEVQVLDQANASEVLDAGGDGADLGVDLGPAPQSPEDIILMAGNTESEQERYAILSGWLAQMDESDPLFEDLTQLVEVIDRWANGLEKYWEPGDQEMAGEGGYLGGFFVTMIWPSTLGVAYPPVIADDSPLYPLWCIYRGRMAIWTAVEQGVLTEQLFTEGQERLQVAHEAFPENRILGMYLGIPIPWEEELEGGGEDVPAWAVSMRASLHKVDAIISFWATVRQAEDGQYGGGWGDDVEMWRKWTSILIGFDDDASKNSWTRLCDGVFALPRMAGGYTNILTDVEHSAEDSADTITSMLLIDPDNSLWQGRARALVDHMVTLWSGTNERGFLQFKSTYFTSDQVDPNPAYACDTNYHVRALQPAFLLWQRDRDDEIGDTLANWLQSWVDAGAREERGKAAGIIPSSIHYPSGEIGGPGDDWWDPGCHINPKTFAYPRAQSLMLRSLVLGTALTRSSVFLNAVRLMADHRRSYLEQTPASVEAGSSSWAAKKMGGGLKDALAKNWLYTGSEEFVDILTQDGGPYLRYLLSEDESALLESLERTRAAFAVNRAMYTSEVRFTDRVFSLAGDYLSALYPESTPPSPDLKTLYQLVTGDVSDPLIFPLPGVRWGTNPRDIAIRVRVNGTEHFEADLVHFGSSTRELEARLLRLSLGTYGWSVTCEGVKTQEGEIESLGPVSLSVAIEPNQVCVLKTQKL